MSVDRLIPSVEDATSRYWSAVIDLYLVDDPDTCEDCLYSAARTENAALALDMALAAASDARRAEDDEIRRSVAW